MHVVLENKCERPKLKELVMVCFKVLLQDFYC
jgi:hypothetical protein